MTGRTYRERQEEIIPLWQRLTATTASITTSNGDVFGVELGAHYILDDATGTTTGVRMGVYYQDTHPEVDLLLVTQTGDTAAYCDACTAPPCVHHDALLEAGAHLAGEAGRFVRNALLDTNTRYHQGTNEPVPALFGDRVGALTFQPAATTWVVPEPVLTPIRLRTHRAAPAYWPDDLDIHIPTADALAGAVINPAVADRIETLSALSRRVFLLLGAPGTGKSATLAHLAATRQVPYLTINSPEQVELFRVGLADGATVLQHSLLVAAIQHPCVIELVDLHRWSDRLDVLDAIEPILNPTATHLSAYYPVTDGAITVPIHPGLVVAATSNRPATDFGEKWLERWTVFPFAQPDRDALREDAANTTGRLLDTLQQRGAVPGERDETVVDVMAAFELLVVDAITALNRDPMLGARHTWGTRALREAIELRLLGMEPNEIAANVFAGKLPRDPALALHALAVVHTVAGWGRPKISALPFANLLSDEQIQAAVAESGGELE